MPLRWYPQMSFQTLNLILSPSGLWFYWFRSEDDKLEFKISFPFLFFPHPFISHPKPGDFSFFHIFKSLQQLCLTPDFWDFDKHLEDNECLASLGDRWSDIKRSAFPMCAKLYQIRADQWSFEIWLCYSHRFVLCRLGIPYSSSCHHLSLQKRIMFDKTPYHCHLDSAEIRKWLL